MHSLGAVGKIDVFACGPSCKDISTRNSKPDRTCYEAGSGANGTSGRTYKYGFKRAIEVLQPKLAFYENVAAVSFSTKDAKRPLIEVVRSDMEDLGYMFVHQKLDSQDFLVPQRRNRVWGIAIPSTGEVDLHNFAAVYSDKLALFASLGIRFPKDDVFNPDAPKDKIESPVLQEHVQNAIEAATLAGRSTDVFVDTATSPQGAMPREALYIYIYIYIYKDT